MKRLIPPMMRYWLLTSVLLLHLTLVPVDVSSDLEDELLTVLNGTALRRVLDSQTNPYIEELQGFWSFNETTDISKYEQFDHTRFQGSRELSLEELLQKARAAAGGGLGRTARNNSSSEPSSSAIPGNNRTSGAGSLLGPLPSLEADRTTVSGLLGGTAYLHCRLKNLLNKPVSWVRKSDWHILTSARQTYTNDHRFQALHQEGTEDWVLQIKSLREEDTGQYLCQVSTGSDILSQCYNLTVLVPRLEILGGGHGDVIMSSSEYHIGEGSVISLICLIHNAAFDTVWHEGLLHKLRFLAVPYYLRQIIVSFLSDRTFQSPSPGSFVSWYHDGELVTSEVPGVTLVTDSVRDENVIQSQLQITPASRGHSGNYSCSSTNVAAQPAAAWVHLFVSEDGDNIAAIQRHESGNTSNAYSNSAVYSCKLLLQAVILYSLHFKMNSC